MSPATYNEVKAVATDAETRLASALYTLERHGYLNDLMPLTHIPPVYLTLAYELAKMSERDKADLVQLLDRAMGVAE
jgi:hypothetical protein